MLNTACLHLLPNFLGHIWWFFKVSPLIFCMYTPLFSESELTTLSSRYVVIIVIILTICACGGVRPFRRKWKEEEEHWNNASFFSSYQWSDAPPRCLSLELLYRAIAQWASPIRIKIENWKTVVIHVSGVKYVLWEVHGVQIFHLRP